MWNFFQFFKICDQFLVAWFRRKHFQVFVIPDRVDDGHEGGNAGQGKDVLDVNAQLALQDVVEQGPQAGKSATHEK
jgi:hypothetical protein